MRALAVCSILVAAICAGGSSIAGKNAERRPSDTSHLKDTVKFKGFVQGHGPELRPMSKGDAKLTAPKSVQRHGVKGAVLMTIAPRERETSLDVWGKGGSALSVILTEVVSDNWGSGTTRHGHLAVRIDIPSKGGKTGVPRNRHLLIHSRDGEGVRLDYHDGLRQEARPVSERFMRRVLQRLGPFEIDPALPPEAKKVLAKLPAEWDVPHLQEVIGMVRTSAARALNDGKDPSVTFPKFVKMFRSWDFMKSDLATQMARFAAVNNLSLSKVERMSKVIYDTNIWGWKHAFALVRLPVHAARRGSELSIEQVAQEYKRQYQVSSSESEAVTKTYLKLGFGDISPYET